jgi:DNA-binding MarR family transcriptional regulator
MSAHMEQSARIASIDPLAAQLLSALMRLQKLHSDMTVLQARAFFAVAAAPGSPQRMMLKSLASTDSAVSRAMAVLSCARAKEGRAGGLGLVEYDENPLDRREKLMWLSRKGQHLFEEIMHDFGRPTPGLVSYALLKGGQGG